MAVKTELGLQTALFLDLYMRLYLSRIEGPPPKRNAARSNRARRAKNPSLVQSAADSTLLTKTGVLLCLVFQTVIILSNPQTGIAPIWGL